MGNKKKRKLNIKKALRVFISLLLLTILIYNKNNIVYFFQSKITGYSVSTVRLLHNFNVYDGVKKFDYSDTIEKIINTEYFVKNNIKYYVNIDYKKRNSFFNNVNQLIDLKYNANDINNIYSVLSDDDIDILLANDYLKDISNILNLGYFHHENLERYILYSKDSSLSYIDNVTYVNIGLDNDYYTNVIKIEETDNIQIIVNKYHSLDSKYVPSDLEKIDSKYNKGSNNLMKKEAKEAFEKMCGAALSDNIKIYSGSAYRSYNYQLNLYNRYVLVDGKRKADTYAARAGFSEHQTGLATDIMNAKLEYISEGDKEYDWLINNSYKYGFILRYPKNKEDITGYMYEEWHFRYIGIEDAKKLYDLGITYDEYVARQ